MPHLTNRLARRALKGFIGRRITEGFFVVVAAECLLLVIRNQCRRVEMIGVTIVRCHLLCGVCGGGVVVYLRMPHVNINATANEYPHDTTSATGKKGSRKPS